MLFNNRTIVFTEHYQGFGGRIGSEFLLYYFFHFLPYITISDKEFKTYLFLTSSKVYSFHNLIKK
jgi:hypothetical protein